MEDKNSKRKPCKECPFKRREPEEARKYMGGSPVEVYIGQALGPFWLPCHMDKGYQGKQSNPEEVIQCAGAAIFRANCGISEMLPESLLRLPSDYIEVYESPLSFISSVNSKPPYRISDLTEAVKEFRSAFPKMSLEEMYRKLTQTEMEKLEVRIIKKIKI